MIPIDSKQIAEIAEIEALRIAANNASGGKASFLQRQADNKLSDAWPSILAALNEREGLRKDLAASRGVFKLATEQLAIQLERGDNIELQLSTARAQLQSAKEALEQIAAQARRGSEDTGMARSHFREGLADIEDAARQTLTAISSVTGEKNE